MASEALPQEQMLLGSADGEGEEGKSSPARNHRGRGGIPAVPLLRLLWGTEADRKSRGGSSV